MAAVSVPAVFKLYKASITQAAGTADFFSRYPTTINGILINSKNHAMKFFFTQPAVYSVWFGCFDDIITEAGSHSRHKHNSSAFVLSLGEQLSRCKALWVRRLVATAGSMRSEAKGRLC